MNSSCTDPVPKARQLAPHPHSVSGLTTLFNAVFDCQHFVLFYLFNWRYSLQNLIVSISDCSIYSIEDMHCGIWLSAFRIILYIPLKIAVGWNFELRSLNQCWPKWHDWECLYNDWHTYTKLCDGAYTMRSIAWRVSLWKASGGNYWSMTSLFVESVTMRSNDNVIIGYGATSLHAMGDGLYEKGHSTMRIKH